MSIERDKEFEQLEDIAAMMAENSGIEFENGKYVYYGLDARTAFVAVYISGAWSAWQAKASAAPEGFALVPIHTLEECLSWAHVAKWDSPSKEVENEIEHHELIIESIIEAQEPKFNLDEFLLMEQKLKSKGGIIKADLDRFIAYAEMVLEKAKATKEPK